MRRRANERERRSAIRTNRRSVNPNGVDQETVGGPRGAADSRSRWAGTWRQDARSIQSVRKGEGPTASSGAERVLAWETTRHWEQRVSSCVAEACAAPSAERSSSAASPECAICAPAIASRPCSTGTASCTTSASRPTAAERRRRKRGPGMRGKTFMGFDGVRKEQRSGARSSLARLRPRGLMAARWEATPVAGVLERAEVGAPDRWESARCDHTPTRPGARTQYRNERETECQAPWMDQSPRSSTSNAQPDAVVSSMR